MRHLELGGPVPSGARVVRREAAKAVVERDGLLLLLLTPRTGDHKLPGGGVHPGETHEQTLQRELREETGYEVAFGAELPDARYRDHKGRPKLVRYWAMTVVGGAFEPNDEVDEVRWLPVDAAAGLLSYGHDAALLERLPAT